MRTDRFSSRYMSITRARCMALMGPWGGQRSLWAQFWASRRQAAGIDRSPTLCWRESVWKRQLLRLFWLFGWRQYLEIFLLYVYLLNSDVHYGFLAFLYLFWLRIFWLFYLLFTWHIIYLFLPQNGHNFLFGYRTDDWIRFRWHTIFVFLIVSNIVVSSPGRAVTRQWTRVGRRITDFNTAILIIPYYFLLLLFLLKPIRTIIHGALEALPQIMFRITTSITL